MMNNETDTKLKNDIAEYIKINGISGFFGLLATIFPEKVDAEDLRKYNASNRVTEEKLNIPFGYREDTIKTDGNKVEIKEASIYAEEHIPAVQEDMLEASSQKQAEEQPKRKVLEATSKPNPWGDAEVVLPGQLKL